MASKENREKSAPKRASAPELPHEIAEQYGLHRERHNVRPGAAQDARLAADDSGEPATSGDGPPQKDTPGIINDAKTDAAVDDILTKEGDDLLAMQDAQHASETVHQKRGFFAGMGHFFASWWRNKWARWITIIVLLAVLVATIALPKARYAVLNAVGVRSSASVIVLDDTTQLPLKNVAASLGNYTVRTDSKGMASFQKLRLGDYTLTVQRLAFAPQRRDVTIGWGSNPLGTFNLRATGIQYELSAIDYLSGYPIRGAEATNDELTALSDAKGKMILTVEDTRQTTLSVKVVAAGYRPQTVVIDAKRTTVAKVRLVPAGKTAYMLQQNGKYNMYTSDLDGKNKRLLLPGTGNEADDIGLAISPDNRYAALVATRDSRRDRDGFKLYSLTMADLRSGATATVDYAQQIRLIQWSGGNLVYRKTIASESASNATRSRIISFNYDKNAKTQLAAANQFTVATSAQGAIYYAPSSTDPQAALGLYRVNADGSARKRVFSQEVWAALRTSYDTLHLQTPDSWHALTFSSGETSKVAAPGNAESYAFVAGPKAGVNAWNDVRNGKGALHLYYVKTSANTTLAERDGLTGPIHWVGGKALVFRVVTAAESADYAISPAGGPPHKIADVAATRGFGQ